MMKKYQDIPSSVKEGNWKYQAVHLDFLDFRIYNEFLIEF